MQTITCCVSVGTALLVALLAIQPARAALLYYESFSEASYPVVYDGTDPNIGDTWAGGPHPDGPYEPEDEILTGSLDTTGTLAHPASGGKINFLGPYDPERGVSQMGSSTGADDTTRYASLLIDLNDPGSLAQNFTGVELWNNAITPGVGTNRSVKIGLDGAAYAIGTNSGTGSVALDPGLNFIVLKFTYGAGDNDTVDVFINPMWDDLLNNNFSGQLTGGDFAFDRIALANHSRYGATIDGFADEIRVGTTLADVVLAPVPEPSTLALLSLAGLFAMLNTWRGRVRKRNDA